MANSRISIDEILAAVRRSGGRVTPTKRALIHVLMESSTHLTAEELTVAVQRLEPETSPSTIYRTLEDLEGLGVVVHSHMGRSAAVFHLAGPVHGHLVCEDCGMTIEVPSSTFETLARTAQRDFGFEINRHHLAISGQCASCAGVTGQHRRSLPLWLVDLLRGVT